MNPGEQRRGLGDDILCWTHTFGSILCQGIAYSSNFVNQQLLPILCGLRPFNACKGLQYTVWAIQSAPQFEKRRRGEPRRVGTEEGTHVTAARCALPVSFPGAPCLDNGGLSLHCLVCVKPFSEEKERDKRHVAPGVVRARLAPTLHRTTLSLIRSTSLDPKHMDSCSMQCFPVGYAQRASHNQGTQRHACNHANVRAERMCRRRRVEESCLSVRRRRRRRRGTYIRPARCHDSFDDNESSTCDERGEGGCGW